MSALTRSHHLPGAGQTSASPRVSRRAGPAVALAAAILAAVWATTACDQLTRIGDTETACVPTAVQAAFDRSCARAGCHDAAGAAAGLVLTAAASADVIGRASSQQPLPLVTIGDPHESYMAHKLSLDPPAAIVGSRMPVGFDPDNVEQAGDVATILGWIAGAELPGCSEGSDETGGETTGGGPAVPNGLPCPVDELLGSRCRSCHSDPPSSGAPFPLVTHGDLLAPVAGDAAVIVAQRMAARMADAAAPMPPPPGAPVNPDRLAAFNEWLAAGTPVGMCNGPGPAGPDPFELEPRCTSNRYWDRGDDGHPQMHPGRDCITCHDVERQADPDDPDIPDLVIGGTVYPTGHEPNDCIGTSGADLRVVILSVPGGVEVTLSPGTSGNFVLHRADAPSGFEPPFSVKLVEGDRERIMPIEAPVGSCNVCHTQDGTAGAPGRVVAP